MTLEISETQNHLAIQHLKVKVSNLEKADHEMDKTMERVILNQEHHRKRLDELLEKTNDMFDKHSARIDILEKKEERAEAKRELISKFINGRAVLWAAIIILLLIGATNSDLVKHFFYNS